MLGAKSRGIIQSPPCCTAQQTAVLLFCLLSLIICSLPTNKIPSLSSQPIFPICTHNFYLIHPLLFLLPLPLSSPPFIPHSIGLPDGVLFCRRDPLMPSNRAGNILKGFGQGRFGSLKYHWGICIIQRSWLRADRWSLLIKQGSKYLLQGVDSNLQSLGWMHLDI